MNSRKRSPLALWLFHSLMAAYPSDAMTSPLALQAHQAIKELMHEGESANTRSSYQSAMRYWAAWHVLRLSQPMQLPLSVACVLQFMNERYAQRQTALGLQARCRNQWMSLGCLWLQGEKRPPSHNTLVHRMAVLSKRIRCMPCPTLAGMVQSKS